MGTIKEEAQAYEPQEVKNISELDKVPTDLSIEEREFDKDDGTTFKIKIVNVKGEDYRIPVSVLKSLKAILEDNPNLKTFKVKRNGEGMKTVYTVIPLA